MTTTTGSKVGCSEFPLLKDRGKSFSAVLMKEEVNDLEGWVSKKVW